MARANVWLVLLTVASMAITTVAGNPAESSDGPVPVVLDVLRTVELAPPEASTGAFRIADVTELPIGLVKHAALNGVCNLYVLVPGEHVASARSSLLSCQGNSQTADGAGLIVHDPDRNLAVFCNHVDGEELLIEGRDAATLEVRWSITARDAANAGSPLSTEQTNPTPLVKCHSGALTPAGDALVIPIRPNAISSNERAAWMLWVDPDDGTIMQATPLDGAPDPLRPSEATTRLEPAGILMATRTGFILPVYDYWNSVPSVAWYDVDGRLVGLHRSAEPAAVNEEDGGVGTSPQASRMGAVRGDEFVIHDGKGLVFVRPTDTAGRFVPMDLGHTRYAQANEPDIVWTDARVIAAAANSIAAYDTYAGREVARWVAGAAADIDAIHLLDHANLAVAYTNEEASGLTAYVALLDATELTTLAQVRLPLAMEKTVRDPLERQVDYTSSSVEEEEQPSGRIHLLPISDGTFLASNGEGEGVVLGVPAEASQPRVAVSTQYPQAGETVELTTEAPDRPLALLVVYWGDGTSQAIIGTEPASHSYQEEFQRTIRVVATYTDDTTATQWVTMHVGEPEPVVLTPLQRAFAPENQELTFFLLGLFITFVVGVTATVTRRADRSRSRTILKRLHAISRSSREDASGAMHDLMGVRRAVADLGEAGRLRDIHLATVQLEADRTHDRVWARLLGRVEESLDPEIRSRIDAALRDGDLDASELTEIDALLSSSSRGTQRDRERIRGVLRTLAEPR